MAEGTPAVASSPAEYAPSPSFESGTILDRRRWFEKKENHHAIRRLATYVLNAPSSLRGANVVVSGRNFEVVRPPVQAVTLFIALS
jgi:hypothetical protein